MIKLTAKQEKIVNHVNGAILVKAGPGSGKTSVLIERIKRLLKTKKRCKVLALTFTNMAADQMKNILEEDDSIGDLIQNVTIGTIHSFCLELVQTRGNLVGLGNHMVIFENQSDQQAVLREVLTNEPYLIDKIDGKKKSDVISEYLKLISEQKKKFIVPELCDIKDPFPFIYKEYNRQLMKQNALDFDDIIFYAYKILTENPSVVKLYNAIYKFVCVDEAQDLNLAQYEVLKALCGDGCRNLMLVGDEKQSIYHFNGSDSRLMSERFIKEYQPTVYYLDENFRSAKAIVNFANQLENYESSVIYAYEGELQAYSFESEKNEAEFVIHKIKELLDTGHRDIEGNLDYGSFAVIARNRYVFCELLKLMEKENMPHFYKKNTKGIESESDIMRMFDLGMRVLLNPKDVVHLREMCNMTKYDFQLIQEKTNTFDLLESMLSESKYRCLLNALKSIDCEKLEMKKVLETIETQIPQSVSDEEKYLIINDIAQWKKHWNKYTSQVPRENRTLLSFRNYISLGKTQGSQLNKGIALLTAHMSKGSQYDVVFVMGLSEGTFPDYRALNYTSKIEEEKNNMYVAVTRAKRLCYLSYSRSKKMPWGETKHQKASRFLKGIEIHTIKEHIE